MSQVNLAEAARLIETDPGAAAAKAREAIAADSSNPVAYRLLGAALRRLGDDSAANEAELSAIQLSANDPDLVRAGQASAARDYRTAETILRPIVEARPNDVVAIQMLGEVAAACGLLNDAELLHRRALALAPGFEYARLHLGSILNNQGRPGESLAELRNIQGEILAFEGFRMLLADVLSQLGESDEAIEIYCDFTAAKPANPDLWSRLSFLFNSLGKRDEAVATARSAMDIPGVVGTGWWALADLKSYRFSDDEIAAMEQALAIPDLRDRQRASLHFALGKAFEDRAEFQSSFDHYRRANELRKGHLKYNPEWGRKLLETVRGVFTKEFLNSRDGAGEPSADPIFIIGMPRSGSTLLEQILASHPLIEGTAELPDLDALAISLQPDPRQGPRNVTYMDRLAALEDAELRELGRLYVERTRVYRKTDRPFFLDKMPSNWAHTGFIRLILPNAKIIDMRRNPLACGFSVYKQMFGRGHEFSYDLANIGDFYRNYVDVMAHFDTVAPGKVQRVIYDRLVDDPEAEIRKLLDSLGLPFDEACVRFYETRRSVRTPSSEQVRQPMNRGLIDHWTAFEAELGPLKEALGPALEHWNDQPSS